MYSEHTRARESAPIIVSGRDWKAGVAMAVLEAERKGSGGPA